MVLEPRLSDSIYMTLKTSKHVLFMKWNKIWNLQKNNILRFIALRPAGWVEATLEVFSHEDLPKENKINMLPCSIAQPCIKRFSPIRILPEPGNDGVKQFKNYAFS